MTKKPLIGIVVVILFGGLFIALSLGNKEPKDTGLAFLSQKIVRQPAAAGQFYPAGAKELEEVIDGFLEKVQPPEAEGEIFALVLPHAGYQFSGQVAACGAKQLAGRNIDTVILIGNSHNERFEGVSVFPKGFYETPLGEVEVDFGLASTLIAEHKRIFFRQGAHQREHSLEVEVPFLQRTLKKGFKVVPILFGNSHGDDYKILAQALLKHIQNRNVLLIASSDLSHYPSYENANHADKKTTEAILTGDVEKLDKAIEGLEKEGIAGAVTFACGEDAMKTVMLVAKGLGADEIKLLKYANSGDVSAGDRERVVGYGAIAFFAAPNKIGKLSDFVRGEEEGKGSLNKEQQETLLKIARTTVENVTKEGKIPSFKIEDEALQQKLGAFVTLKKYGQLRGCIGRFSPTNPPLYQTVSAMAAAAATQDVRFSPVREDELTQLHYEISVLSPLRKIDGWQEIELGKHGVQLRKGLRSGVFLPQVATENNWDMDKFMGELCSQKAGLEWDCWKSSNVELYTFTAQVFEEE